MSVADPKDSALVKLVLSLLDLCKLATSHHKGKDILGIIIYISIFFIFSLFKLIYCPCIVAAGSCLGELGPVDFSTIALLHGRDPLYKKATSLFTSSDSQCIYIILNCINDMLTDQRYTG